MTVDHVGDRPSDAALWASLEQTLRDAVLPKLDDPHTRQTVMNLIGLAAYARTRGDDPSGKRLDELVAVLDELDRAGDPLVSQHWSAGSARDLGSVLATYGALLATTVADDRNGGSPQTRTRLRSVLLRHLDEDLATEDVLLGAFRGRLPDG
jgi:hypothetical protein